MGERPETLRPNRSVLTANANVVTPTKSGAHRQVSEKVIWLRHAGFGGLGTDCQSRENFGRLVWCQYCYKHLQKPTRHFPDVEQHESACTLSTLYLSSIHGRDSASSPRPADPPCLRSHGNDSSDDLRDLWFWEIHSRESYLKFWEFPACVLPCFDVPEVWVSFTS